MVFKVDFRDGKTVTWSKNCGELSREEVDDFHPRFYIGGDLEDLFQVRTWLSRKNGVEATCLEKWFTSLKDRKKKKVLRVDVSRPEKVSDTAHRVISNFPRQDFQFYNVSLTPQFRYCLQKGVEPVPEDLSEITEMRIAIPRQDIAEDSAESLEIDGKKVAESEIDALEFLGKELEVRDPDLLYVNNSQVLPFLEEKISSYNLGFSLGRMEGFEKLAGENTVSSYGHTLHSSARYNIPGRIVIDESNSFLLGEATVEGLWDLVERSWKPLQELAWGSIGRLLTAIEVKQAYLEEDTLTPWKNWDGENFKSAETLHKADRGGYIFNPEPGIYEDVYEADFASLFPNIMVKKNISPETVCCNCCDNHKVPELDYSICQERRGFISEVLEPLVEDRQLMKQLVEEVENEDRERYLQGSIDAIKWLLVSCFGYMGHAHASYGAIECHQAIQAYDRQIMSQTKDLFYEDGYEIVHGIVDSIWVQKRNDEAVDIEKVCAKVTDEIGIELEFEDKFQWVAFVPRKSRESNVGTLNRYFGVKENGSIKTAGIEAEQRSTPQYIKDCQKQLIQVFHKERDPRNVLEVLKQQIVELNSGGIKPEDLVIRKRASKSLESYQQNTRTVSALKRYRENGVKIKPGEDVEFVVHDEQRTDGERVRLPFEDFVGYDEDFYTEKLIDSAVSVLSPLGWSENRIKAHLSNSRIDSLCHY